jgi:flagellar hook assembly protein FlgD
MRVHGLFRLVAGITIALWLLGASDCTQNSNSDAPQFVTTLQVEDSSAVASTSFAQGQPISLVLTIRNRTDTTQTLYFNTTEAANLAAVDAGTATVIWNCDNDTTTSCVAGSTPNTASTATSSSSGAFTQITLAAFQSQTVTFTWNGNDNNGNELPVGNYEVLGGFTVYNTTGPGDAADNGSSMAEGVPTATQLFPSVYISTLSPFSITTAVTQ